MINVAIDGPAGAGKSTVAKAVAKKLGLIYLDTGAMYRATAYTALEAGLDVSDAAQISPMLDGMKMEIVFEEGVQQIYVNGANTTPYLREHRMSKAASDISALPCVRYKMVELQREFAATGNVVLDGRDIGTFVLPNANCKIFMTATPEERANRRYKELVEKGQEVDYDTLLTDIKQRDYNDSHREVAPLKQAEDAVLLDTTHMPLEEVIAAVIGIVENKISSPSGGAGAHTGGDGNLNAAEKSNAISEAENDKPSEECSSANKAKEDILSENKNMTDAKNLAHISKKEAKRAANVKKRYKLEKNFGFYRFLRVFLHPLAAMLWPTKLIGIENVKEVEGKNAIFTCNHYSKVDTLLPCFALFKREAHILAKSELFESNLVGWFLHKLGAIPVRRGEADINCVKCVLRLLNDGKQLMIFPEGTRNKQGTQDMAEFKSGTARFAIKTRSPIVPMLYYAPPKLFKRNYLYIGEPFTLEEFYGDRSHDAMDRATEVVREKMDEVRTLVNAYVEDKKGKRDKGDGK